MKRKQNTRDICVYIRKSRKRPKDGKVEKRESRICTFVYIYNLADALVDSHLSDFDEKDEKVDKTQN